MNWLTLRILRPYLLVAAALSAASVTFILVSTRIIAQQADAHGVAVEPYAAGRTGLCEQAVTCLPLGVATNLAQAVILVAAFAPLLIGLILGVPLFAREREESTDAFVLTQSVPRSRWLSTKLMWALTASAVCTAAVAVTFRLGAARYTLVVSNAGYDLLREVHKNSIGFMVMQTVCITALAGVIGLASGRTLSTLVLSVVAWPMALIVAQIGGLLLGMLTHLLTWWSESLSMMSGSQTEDETATYSALALAACTIVVVLVGRRMSAPADRRR